MFSSPRALSWDQLQQPWDLIIIGGGITGAEILYEAARQGLQALLVEARDFSFGTSSRSGKIVHGGIRYLRNHQYNVSFESVRERERLIDVFPGLINRSPFNYVSMSSDHSPAWRLGLEVFLYELFAGRVRTGYIPAERVAALFPPVKKEGLIGGFCYTEGIMDDSRMVLRILQEAVRCGGVALNYARACGLLRQHSGKVTGILLRDEHPSGTKQTAEVFANVIINATGPCTDDIRSMIQAPQRIRKSRGSHLLIRGDKLPIHESLCYYHPRDQRIQFIMPWQGTFIAGTTDLDHDPASEEPHGEPGISRQESDYILEGLQYIFPGVWTEEDIVSTFCGVRPIIASGADQPSKESRRYALWHESGLITIAGGKLTTYRLMARAALRFARQFIHRGSEPNRLPAPTAGCHNDLPASTCLTETQILNLYGKYGFQTTEFIQSSQPAELEPIGNTQTLWAELRWAARHEHVVHLDDLLLRRVRLGLTTPQGGSAYLARIRAIVQDELGWTDEQWAAEEAAYLNLWRSCYWLPQAGFVEKPG